MPNPSHVSTSINLEFVRKEAKSLLKLCRSRDHAALMRIRESLTRFTALNDEQAAAEIQLADIQYVLARESGLSSWSDLKRVAQASTPPPSNFSKPGSDGMALPEGFNPWQWCVSYTVRPELLSPLVEGREYRIVVRTINRTPSDVPSNGYRLLYERASEITKHRVSQLKCATSNGSPQTRILAHGWWKNDRSKLAMAFIGTAVSYLKDGETMPPGQLFPGPDELAAPGGMTPENLHVPPPLPKTIEEVYSEADARDLSDKGANIFLISYGEYVPTCEALDYKPFVERAENLARFYGQPEIVRREWFCATNPDIAVVHLYIQENS